MNYFIQINLFDLITSTGIRAPTMASCILCKEERGYRLCTCYVPSDCLGDQREGKPVKEAHHRLRLRSDKRSPEWLRQKLIQWENGRKGGVLSKTTIWASVRARANHCVTASARTRARTSVSDRILSAPTNISFLLISFNT